MKRNKPIVCLLTGLALTGCHGTPEPNPVYVEATRQPEPQMIVKEVEVPVATPQLRPLPAVTPSGESESTSPADAVAEARDNATQRPTPGDFIEAIQTYDYLPGAVYEVYASPGHVTTIALEPGEELIAKVAGDTARWFVGDSHAEYGADARTLLVIKPLKPGVQTNLVVSTDRRVYHLDLRCVTDLPGAGAYHSEVRWNYPADLARQLARRYRAEAEKDAEVVASLDLARLDFGYRVHFRGKSKDAPDWMPRRAFTDGRKTYIGFPDNLDVMEAPPLFVLSDKNEAQLVNYRVRSNYYIVDQVIRRAELRLGEATQQVVTIERTSEAENDLARAETNRPHYRR